MALIDKLTAIADAIRGKTGGTESLTLDEMATAISGISTSCGGFPTPTAGDTPVILNDNYADAPASPDMSDTGVSIGILNPGMYRFKAIVKNSYTATSAASGNASNAQIYHNGSAIGSATSISGKSTVCIQKDITCSEGDVITVYASSAHSTYKTTVCCLIACIDWDTKYGIAITGIQGPDIEITS